MPCYSRTNCYNYKGELNCTRTLLPWSCCFLWRICSQPSPLARKSLRVTSFLFMSELVLWPCHFSGPHGFTATGWTSPVGNASDSEMGFPKTKWTLFLPFQRLKASRSYGRPSCACVLCWVAQLCPTLCIPMDGSPPGSSDHGVLHGKPLEWAAVPSPVTPGSKGHPLSLLH